jgi:hypothetical protein
MKRRLKLLPVPVLGLFLAVILFGSAALVSAQIQTPQPTPGLEVTPAPALAEPEPAIKVIIQESYIQERMEEEVEDDPTFSHPVIDLRAPNLALITVNTRVNTFITVRPTATVEFDVNDEEVTVDVVRLDINGLNVPRAFVERQINELREQIQDELNDLTGALTDANLRLSGISATDDTLIISLEPLEEEDLENGTDD